jgi:hypothetical protein
VKGMGLRQREEVENIKVADDISLYTYRLKGRRVIEVRMRVTRKTSTIF